MLAVWNFESIAPSELAQKGVVQQGSFDRMSVLGVKKKKKQKKKKKRRVCNSESIAPCGVLRDAGQAGVCNGHVREFESLTPW